MKSEPTSDDEKRVELDDSNNDVGIDSVNYYLFIKPPELEKHIYNWSIETIHTVK